MFDRIHKACDALYGDGELETALSTMRELKIPSIRSYFGIFSERLNTSPFRVSEKDSARLKVAIASCADGVERLDSLIDEIRAFRNQLAGDVMSMRMAYAPDELRDVVEELSRIAVNRKPGNSARAMELLARLLGKEKLPPDIVRVDVANISYDVVVRFGVMDKPTSVGIAIPRALEVDRNILCDDEHDIPSSVIAEASNMKIKVVVDPGIVYGKSGCVRLCQCYCSNLNEVSAVVDKAIATDMRTSIGKVEGVMACKDVDDFIRWRNMRHADMEAGLNKEEGVNV